MTRDILRSLFSFKGRLARIEFCVVLLVPTALLWLSSEFMWHFSEPIRRGLADASVLFSSQVMIGLGALTFVVAWLVFSALTRRAHDLGLSMVYVVLWLIVVLNVFASSVHTVVIARVLIVLTFAAIWLWPGMPAANRFGEPRPGYNPFAGSTAKSD